MWPAGRRGVDVDGLAPLHPWLDLDTPPGFFRTVDAITAARRPTRPGVNSAGRGPDVGKAPRRVLPSTANGARQPTAGRR